MLTQEEKDFQDLINQPITFQGPSGTYERTMMKSKIQELINRIGEYYSDTENKLIAIPYQISDPLRINPDGTKSVIGNTSWKDKLEEKLHQSIIKAVREMKLHALVFKRFLTIDAIDGKARNPDLNIHENEIMEVLDIKNLDDEEVENCSQLLKVLKIREKHKEFKEGEPSQTKKYRVECVQGESLLFSTVNMI